MIRKYFDILCLGLMLTVSVSAQDYVQTVRGKLIDIDSHTPVLYAAVLLSNSTFNSNTITNELGAFRIGQVPIGRYNLKVSCMAYNDVDISNLEVTMGKELVIEIEMTERIIEIDEVSVKAYNQKEKPLNTFASVSARTFSVEESQRYAGSMNDVSRMATNFAGVSMSAETTNEIVIRGNSPVGVLFRLDGVDIPNPNHFGDGGTTGGPISMLNNNVLSNSDFLTGAFPAEYGNTISGVFDLRMRNGNSEDHEFIFQAGLMGFEAGVEGPISKKYNASYILNYRYSTISILRSLGMDVMGTAQTDYQDLSFKLNFPSRKIGTISLFGFGGNSYMHMFDSERDTTEERKQMAYESDYEIDIINDNYSGALGLTHSFILGNSAYTKLILSASTIYNYNKWDSLSTETRIPILQYHSDFQRTKYAAKFILNKKINSKNTIRTGISTEMQQFNLSDSMLVAEPELYRTLRDYRGDGLLSQVFIQYQRKFSERVRLTLGLNSILLSSNNSFNLEPRTGLKWEIIPGHTFSLGYGLHSISPPVEILNQVIMLEDGTYFKPNTGLDLTRSHHFVMGYDTRLFERIILRSEIYYQYITNAMIEVNRSSYSFINHGAYTITDVEALNNEGKGYNYGLELTLEKFMDRGTYFLSTLSLYESKYRGSDGVLRNTAFNSNYVFNLLGGKEFNFGSHRKESGSKRKFVIDGKINWAGGQRYTPIDMEASEAAGTTVYDEQYAFSNQLPDYFRIDLRIAYKWTGKHSSQELALDIRNLTNRKNPFYIKYDVETGDLKTHGFGLTPDLLYRITF